MRASVVNFVASDARAIVADVRASARTGTRPLARPVAFLCQAFRYERACVVRRAVVFVVVVVSIVVRIVVGIAVARVPITVTTRLASIIMRASVLVSSPVVGKQLARSLARTTHLLVGAPQRPTHRLLSRAPVSDVSLCT